MASRRNHPGDQIEIAAGAHLCQPRQSRPAQWRRHRDQNDGLEDAGRAIHPKRKAQALHGRSGHLLGEKGVGRGRQMGRTHEQRRLQGSNGQL
ncbi:hypothetical protein FQZ97_1167770 [compost metagenome]